MSVSTGGGAGGDGSGGDPTGTGGAGGAPVGSGGGGAGGGGTGGESSGSGVAICDDVDPTDARVEACTTYAESLCAYYAECQIPSYLFIGGDHDLCLAQTVPACTLQKNVDEAELVVCLDDLATLYDDRTCGLPLGYDYPASCLRVGNLADGEACFHDFECHNGLCVIEGAGCGTCAPLRGEGTPCTDDQTCELPLSCIEGECAGPAVDGTPCDSARDCAGLACVESVCASITIGGPGDDCGDLAECDPSAELRCDAKSGTCVANPTPEPGALGAECVQHQVDYGGSLLNVRLCEAGTVCLQGLCVEAAPPGEACPVDGTCAASICEEGTCTPPDPNDCPCGD